MFRTGAPRMRQKALETPLQGGKRPASAGLPPLIGRWHNMRLDNLRYFSTACSYGRQCQLLHEDALQELRSIG